MKILGIETSCDETGVAILKAQDKTTHLLANTISSSLSLHAKTGGIIPEIAARQQLTYMLPALEDVLTKSKLTYRDIDAIAVTVGPGLIGSLLVGVETAKTLGYIWKKPIIPVNHLIGHIYANWIVEKNDKKSITFPALALVVSGGHTDLVLVRNHGKITWLGGTRDDAAGEAFDKIGRLLNLPYPAGPIIEKEAKTGNPKAFHFPRPMIDTKDFDFSFSGLKTAVLRETKLIKQLQPKILHDLAASVQEAVVDVLTTKTLKAVKKYNVKSLLLSGGVAANQALRDRFTKEIKKQKMNVTLFVPPKHLCTDNAAMIASAAFFNYKEVPWKKITANPELYFN